MNTATLEIATVGTPLINPYGKHGFIAAVKDAPAGSFVIGAGMQRSLVEYVCCFEDHISELVDGIAAPFIERARRANLPAVPESEIAARMEAVRQVERERREQAQRDSDEAKRQREEFEADAAGRIPSWAKAVLVAELIEDKSDSMTDYYGSTTRRSVILGFSSHTRDLFPEMRKAASNFAETAHLANAPESAEHREKWSMGGGYYLKDGYRHSSGWQVSKHRIWNAENPVKNLPTAAEWSLGETAPAAKPEAPSVDGMRIEQHTHTKKGFDMFICVLPERVDRAEFDRLRDHAATLRGWYSRPWAGTPGGFAFKDRTAAETFAGSQSTNKAEGETAAPAVTAARPNLAEKLRDMADKLESQIEDKFRDRLSNTPKRQREAASARQDGHNLKRAQSAMRALADCHERGDVPPDLAKVTTKAEIMRLSVSRIDRSNAGYYDAGIDMNEPATDSPAARALWAMVDGPTEAERAAEVLRRKVDALQFAKIPGYFPTPLAVVEQMIFHADMPAGAFDMLEPEGGSAAILDVVRSRFPAAGLTTYERHNSLREVLKLKGYDLAGADFMEAEAAPRFDRVLMNPPFENGQDIEHVRHAFAMLKPGGRLVSVMSPGPFFRQDRKAQAFRDWFDGLAGEKIDLPDGSFKKSGTGTASVLIVLDAEG